MNWPNIQIVNAKINPNPCKTQETIILSVGIEPEIFELSTMSGLGIADINNVGIELIAGEIYELATIDGNVLTDIEGNIIDLEV
ncbi:hypothetical protein C3B58_12690 [Lactonifactor longoviformis]|uniref:Uncharacterized protein n=2 Tax=Lactonifactor TaxID=420345 RepID=A0A1M5CXX5_9CLOT|nr:hypothetical protein C3B58_12690 [Lactonifactor longoviformis]SHF59535.1 hypothetical protein SAMN02745158_04337 [Lactonifactor longoviformis DSM 17459]